jgi:hypothetical protein
MNIINSRSSRYYFFYQVFKYIIYALLCYNMVLFYQSELLASAQSFKSGLNPEDFILAFSASIDSLAWIVLLLIFELETSVISDEKLKGSIYWAMLLVKTFCYLFICYAAYGYIARLHFISNASAFNIADICSLIGSSYTYVVTLDSYEPITEAVCQMMNSAKLLQINGTEIIATEAALIDAQRLGWVDIVNSIDWLIIVAILEMDVYLQLHDKLAGDIKKFSQIVKYISYLILFGAAVYWGIKGDFVDFWDAFLWLLAFFFIEMNIFQWHEEKEQEIGIV